VKLALETLAPEIGDPKAGEGVRADAILVREVFTFGRDFGYAQVERESEPGFEQLEVDW
jgi:hypothetical protein